MDEKKYKEALASMLKANDKSALAELLVEYIDPNHITQEIIGQFLNSRSMREGDALVKKVRKGIEVRTLVPGSVHLASEITVSDRINYVLDGADIKVTANEWELESGELGSVGDIQREMILKLKDFYVGKVFSALASVWNATNTPNNYTSVGGSVTSTVLKNAIDRINQTTSGVKAVLGTRAALAPITEFGAFWNDGSSRTEGVPSQLEEVMRTGFLGKYYGAPIVAIDQVYDNVEDYNALIPNDKIVVIGHNVGEFITYGEPRWKQWNDWNPTPPQWYLEVYQRFGMIVDRAEGIYVIGGLS